MTRCAVTQGPYRCEHSVGHNGDCEAMDLSWVGRAVGERLDEIGLLHGVRRGGMSDPVYTRRILEVVTR